jgi:type 1 glutamine amidotransferase
MINKLLVTIGLAILTSSFLIRAEPAIRVLIIDGYSNHDWRHTSECVLALLSESQLCSVEVTSAPRNSSPKYTSWQPEFSDYKVVVQVCNNLRTGDRWPTKVEKAFEDYIRSGGGMLVLHGANNSFPDWPGYNEMIGLGWRPVDQGAALEIVGGRILRHPSGVGEKTRHGSRSDLVVHRYEEHPITKGYPQEWKTTDIELYKYARGPAKNLRVLSYGLDGETGRKWPLEWVVSYGTGRIYNGTFGHVWRDLRQPPAVQCVGFQTTLVRAIQWLAGQPVTYEIPDSFPTKDKVSLRPYDLIYRPCEGWTSLFNGKDLSGWSVHCPTKDRQLEFWKVVNGAIECNSVDHEGHDYNWLISDQEFDDFQLRLRFQVFEKYDGNSGVQFRSRYDTSDQASGGGWLHGPQADIHPPTPLRAGLIYDETWETRRWIYPSLPNAKMVPEKAPESARQTRLSYADRDPDVWNQLEIISQGTQVKTFVNGRLVTDFDGTGILDDADHQKHQVGLQGYLALQLHRNSQTIIRFKDIWIRKIQ